MNWRELGMFVEWFVPIVVLGLIVSGVAIAAWYLVGPVAFVAFLVVTFLAGIWWTFREERP